ncbi:hypothetical protein INT45_008119 [Circinella minor]|uniref:Uncharacterized protein n=1 Tax=Circinella minor TaxID=1195481 RepID=A0A8H7VDV9_9FUNG|nr:hypothetical protein INT45_008119 [Circinella minor]
MVSDLQHSLYAPVRVNGSTAVITINQICSSPHSHNLMRLWRHERRLLGHDMPEPPAPAPAPVGGSINMAPEDLEPFIATGRNPDNSVAVQPQITQTSSISWKVSTTSLSISTLKNNNKNHNPGYHAMGAFSGPLPVKITGERANAPQVEAVMSFVIGCSLALQWEIDGENLGKIKSNLNAWHMHLKNEVTPNMYTVNFHYLRHIHGTIKALGPLRGYSMRSAERAVGFFKRHVKSRVSPGVNAGNIIKRHLIMRNFERVYNPDEFLNDQPEDNDYSVEGYPEAELWDCREGSIYDFLEDFDMREYIKNYWHNQFPDDRALTIPISTTIRVGKRLFMYGRTLYRCQRFPSTARNLDTLIRLVRNVPSVW